MKTIYVLLIILFFSCISSKDEIIGNTEESNFQISDTVKITFILDGNTVSEKTIGKGMQNNTIQYVNWSHNTRDALLRFGEKYRSGIHILETKKHNQIIINNSNR